MYDENWSYANYETSQPSYTASNIKTESPVTIHRPPPRAQISQFRPQNNVRPQGQNFQQLPQMAPYRFKSASPMANSGHPGNRSVIKRTADGKFVCEYCLKTFKSDVGLYYHKPIHTGQWKYTCNVCDRGYMETKKYNAHMESHRKQFQKHSYL